LELDDAVSASKCFGLRLFSNTKTMQVDVYKMQNLTEVSTKNETK